MPPYTPVPVVEAAFGWGPLDDPVWTALSSLCMEATPNRGRSSEWDRFSAGTCTFTFKDTDRRFDPLYSSGPYRRAYLSLPGTAGNYASAPDSAALDITGDIDIRACIAPDDWTPTATSAVAAKFGGAAGLSYILYLRSDGKVELGWSANGSTGIFKQSTVATGFTDGSQHWVRATLDVNDGLGNNVVTFYTSDTGTTWTQLGTAVTTAGTTSIFASTAGLYVGANSDAGERLAGKVYRVKILNGIGGTVVFDASFRNATVGASSFTESSPNAATVTLATSGSPAASIVDDGTALRPNVPIRLRALISGTYYPVWYGFVDAWELAPERANNIAYVTVPATDGFKLLNRAEITESSYVDEVLADSPRLYWRLGEATALTDSSPNRYDATHSPTVTLGADPVVPALADKSVRFVGGHSSYVKAQNSGAIISAFPMTVEFWVQVDSYSVDTSYGLFHQTGGAGTFGAEKFIFYAQHATSDVPKLRIRYTGTASARQRYWTADILDGDAHHVLLAMPSNNIDNATLYLDGAQVVAPAGTADAFTPLGASPPYIGSQTQFLPGYFYIPEAGDDGVAINGRMDEVAFYPSELSFARVTAHYDAGVAAWASESSGSRVGRALDEIEWPSDLRSIDTGEVLVARTAIPTTGILSYLQTIMDAEHGGRLYMSRDGKVTFHSRDRFITQPTETTSQFTFTDDGGANLGYLAGSLRFRRDDILLFNQASVTSDGGNTRSAQDTVSVREYGPLVKRLDGLPLANDSQAQMIADYIVWRYKDPLSRADAWRVNPEITPATWATVLGLEIGHRVTLESTPVRTGSQIVQAMHIEQIAMTVTPERWDIEFRGSPTDDNVYFEWGGDGATQGWGTGDWR